MTYTRLVFTICILLISNHSISLAQELVFRREIDTIPVFANGVPVQSPFAGGHTSAKPTLVDIDSDGDFDMFVGEREGNIRFYQNEGSNIDPVFILIVENFAIVNVAGSSAPAFTDIDNDGDFDLFVGAGKRFFENGGNIKFYRNTGTATNPIFTSDEIESLTRIDVGNHSTPTFADIDNDGDFDLFVGEEDGNINFYRNTGTAIDAIFTQVTEELAANVDVRGLSTPIFVDIDNDDDLDLFVGEAFGAINFYLNIGTPANPIFTLVTRELDHINVGSDSYPSFTDIDSDGDLDLFVGEATGNISFYRNAGTATSLVFLRETEHTGSIDVGDTSAPTFADIDGDEDFDLFVGDDIGGIHFFQNTGTTTEPIFTSDEIETITSVDVGAAAVPVFADIDNDGDLDLFVGESEGSIKLYQNVGTTTQPIFSLAATSIDSIDVGSNSNPTFADIDKDGDLDLFVGESTDSFTGEPGGNINFYRNMGTATKPSFILETESFFEIDVGSFSSPNFADIDDDGDLDLFVGERSGNINLYRNTGRATDAIFTLESEKFAEIDVGVLSTPTLVDIDNDTDFDLFVGKGGLFGGAIDFYRNSGTTVVPTFRIETEHFVSIDVGLTSAPAFADIDNDGDFDLFIGDNSGIITFYLNIGTTIDPILTFAGIVTPASVNIIFHSSPTFADIDNDGDFDLFVGQRDTINFYRNTGTPTEPIFTLETESYFDIKVDYSAPTFADIDGDTDLDLFVGESSGNINFYRNTGTSTEPIFELEVRDFAGIDVEGVNYPTFVDIDDDEDLDLFVGKYSGTIAFYRNIGTAMEPIFNLEAQDFAGIDVGLISTPTFADIDGDRDFDMIIGNDDGGLHFYRNITPLRGDINNDGRVDVDDLIRVIEIILGTPPEPTDEEETAADVNDDGKIDVRDLIIIINTILGTE